MEKPIDVARIVVEVLLLAIAICIVGVVVMNAFG